jgi:hypothetical protein
MRTLIVSVLSLRLVPFLLEEPLREVALVTWRRRECMLRCFFKARTGLIWKESVPRFMCEGMGDWVGIGDRAWFTNGEWDSQCLRCGVRSSSGVDGAFTVTM